MRGRVGRAPGDAVSAPPFPGIPLLEPVCPGLLLPPAPRIAGFFLACRCTPARGRPLSKLPAALEGSWGASTDCPLRPRCPRPCPGVLRSSPPHAAPRDPHLTPYKGPGRFEVRVKFLRVHSALQNWVTGSGLRFGVFRPPSSRTQG